MLFSTTHARKSTFADGAWTGKNDVMRLRAGETRKLLENGRKRLQFKFIRVSRCGRDLKPPAPLSPPFTFRHATNSGARAKNVAFGLRGSVKYCHVCYVFLSLFSSTFPHCPGSALAGDFSPAMRAAGVGKPIAEFLEQNPFAEPAFKLQADI